MSTKICIYWALYFQLEAGGDNNYTKNHRMQLTDEDKQICTKVVQQYLNGKITDPVTAGRWSQVCGTVSSMFSGLKTRSLGLNTLGTT